MFSSHKILMLAGIVLVTGCSADSASPGLDSMSDIGPDSALLDSGQDVGRDVDPVLDARPDIWPDSARPDTAQDIGKDTGPDLKPVADTGMSMPSWAISAGGAGWDSHGDIAIDGTGNVYITGNIYGGPVSFGKSTLLSLGVCSFIGKIDSSGKPAWAKQLGGLFCGTKGAYLWVGSAGNIYVTGTFKGSLTLGGTTLTSASNSDDVFVAKIDSTGKVIWAISAGNYGNEAATGIAGDKAGDIYVSGHFSGQTTTFGGTTLKSLGDVDGFVAKIGSTNKVIWAKQVGGSGYDHVTALAADATGGIYLAGDFVGQAKFGSTTLTGKGINKWGTFLAKLDGKGVYAWAESLAVDPLGLAIGVNNSGSHIVISSHNGKTKVGSQNSVIAYLSQMDGKGTLLRKDQLTSILPMAVAVNGQGTTSLVGGLYGSGTFGSTKLTSKGSYDIFLAQIDAKGKTLLAKSVGGAKYDIGGSLTTDAKGNTYTLGMFEGSVTLGKTALTSKGGPDIFAARADKNWTF